MLNNLITICLIYFFGVSVKSKLFFNTHIRIGEATFKLSEILDINGISFKDNQRGNCVDFFIFYFVFRGNNKKKC